MGLMYDPQPTPEPPVFDEAYWAKLKGALDVNVNADLAMFGSLPNVFAALLLRVEALEEQVRDLQKVQG